MAKVAENVVGAFGFSGYFNEGNDFFMRWIVSLRLQLFACPCALFCSSPFHFRPYKIIYWSRLSPTSISLKLEVSLSLSMESPVLLLLSLLILTFSVSASATAVRAIFTFGDSIFDAGNNHFNKNCTAQADFPPYGSSFFHRSTGRFTNGRTVVDFICEFLISSARWTKLT